MPGGVSIPGGVGMPSIETMPRGALIPLCGALGMLGEYLFQVGQRCLDIDAQWGMMPDERGGYSRTGGDAQ